VVPSPRGITVEIVSCRVSLEQEICEYSQAQNFEEDFWKQYSMAQNSGFDLRIGIYLTELEMRSGGLLEI